MLWWIAQNALVSALLAAVAAVLCRFGRFSPALKHALWLLVLIKLVTPPFVWYGVPKCVDDALATRLALMLSADRGQPVPWRVERPLVADAHADDTRDFAAELGTTEIGATEIGATGVGSVGTVGTGIASGRSADVLSPPADVDYGPDRIAPTGRLERASGSPWLAFGYLGDSPGEIALRVLGLAWLLGAVPFAAVHTVRVARLWRLVRCPTAELAWLNELVQQVAARLHVRPPEVVVIPARCSPLVCALGRPRLLWPEALEQQLDPEAREAVLLHELAHLRRRDHWVAWLELLAGVIWWFNPVYWYARHQLRETAEVACDAWAIALSRAGRRAYSEALLDVIEFVSSAPAALPAVAMGNVAPSSLERRLTMILRERMSHRVPLLGTGLIGLALLAVLPSWSRGQQSTPDRPKATDAPRAVDRQKPTDVPSTPDPRVYAGLPKPATDLPKEDSAAVDPFGKSAPFDEAAPQPRQTTPRLDAQYSKVTLADAQDADREARIRQVEAKLSALLAEVQALRATNGVGDRVTGTIGPDAGNAARLPPAQEKVPFVPAHPEKGNRPLFQSLRNHNVEELTRVRYELVEPTADKLAELLSLKSKVVASSKAGIIEVVASPEDQATIAAFVELLNKHGAKLNGPAELQKY